VHDLPSLAESCEFRLVAVILAEGGKALNKHSIASRLYKAFLLSPGGREEAALPAKSMI
jgi:hypothetical protein